MLCTVQNNVCWNTSSLVQYWNAVHSTRLKCTEKKSQLNCTDNWIELYLNVPNRIECYAALSATRENTKCEQYHNLSTLTKWLEIYITCQHKEQKVQEHIRILPHELLLTNIYSPSPSNFLHPIWGKSNKHQNNKRVEWGNNNNNNNNNEGNNDNNNNNNNNVFLKHLSSHTHLETICSFAVETEKSILPAHTQEAWLENNTD